MLSPGLLPRGFRFGAVRAGIKPSGRPDLAAALTASPVSAAAMFTSNRVIAAPLQVGQRCLAQTRGRVRAVLVNAGNANCATGAAGVAACEEVCAAAAAEFGCSAPEVFPSSTGIIGVPLPAQKVIDALSGLHAALGDTPQHFADFARAIMTTDTKPKTAQAEITLSGEQVRIAGLAKGAGMIHPQLAAAPHATMLVYLFTDLACDPELLCALLAPAVEASFNRISIDGDTSTNDTVLLLASGGSGAHLGSGAGARPGNDAEAAAFAGVLASVCESLARQIVADGEGVTHVVELRIEGARSDADALRVAKSVAHSPLVKTAWAGSDPNWGRLLAAIGYSGAEIDPARIDIRLDDLELCRDGMRAPGYDEAAAHARLQQREFTITISLAVGVGACRFWTTDLTAEYVRVNAEYST